MRNKEALRKIATIVRKKEKKKKETKTKKTLGHNQEKITSNHKKVGGKGKIYSKKKNLQLYRAMIAHILKEHDTMIALKKIEIWSQCSTNYNEVCAE